MGALATLGAPSEPAHVAKQLGDAIGKLDTEQGGQRHPGRDQDLRERTAALGRPPLVMHAPRDEVVDIDHARRIFDAGTRPKSFVALDGANNLLSGCKDAADAARVLAAWVDCNLPEAAPASFVVDG